jgi:hypothetical protein
MPTRGVIPFGAAELFRDGANLYRYIASSPFAKFDPLGLSVDDFIDDLPGLSEEDLLDGLEGVGDAVGFGGMSAARSMLKLYDFVGKTADLLSDYSMTQSEAVDWALDWSAPDDQYFSGVDVRRMEEKAAEAIESGSGLVMAGKLASGRGGKGGGGAGGRSGPKGAHPDYINPKTGKPRTHGGPSHTAECIRTAKTLSKDHTGVKMNRALCDQNGVPIIEPGTGKRFRPDVYGWKDGTLTVIEVRHSQSVKSVQTRVEDIKKLLTARGIPHNVSYKSTP